MKIHNERNWIQNCICCEGSSKYMCMTRAAGDKVKRWPVKVVELRWDIWTEIDDRGDYPCKIRQGLNRKISHFHGNYTIKKTQLFLKGLDYIDTYKAKGKYTSERLRNTILAFTARKKNMPCLICKKIFLCFNFTVPYFSMALDKIKYSTVLIKTHCRNSNLSTIVLLDLLYFD